MDKQHLYQPTQFGLNFRVDHPMQLREGMASWVVVLRDMKEAVGHSTAEQKTADHSHRDKERKLVAVDPAGRRAGEDLSSKKPVNQ